MSWSDAGFAQIAEYLSAQTGIAFPPSRVAFAEAAIARAMAGARLRDCARYLSRVREDRRLLDAVIAEITVNETYFFRDPVQLDFLREGVCERSGGRAEGTAIRIWSAGCATGEEAYSLAILCEEWGLEAVSILATDICSVAIEKARRGVYGRWSFRETETQRRNVYFSEAGRDCWQIAPRFRSRVQFRTANLVDSQAFPLGGTWDVILCRNVLMYFDEATVSRVATSLAGALECDGVLVTSGSDPILRDVDDLCIETTPAGLTYRRRSAFQPGTNVPETAEFVAPPRRSPSHRKPSRRRPAPAAPPQSRDAAQFDPGPYLQEAMLLLDADKPAEAIVAARRVLYLDRRHAFAHVLLARALRLTGRRAAARRTIERVRRFDIDDEISGALEAEAHLLELTTGAASP